MKAKIPFIISTLLSLVFAACTYVEPLAEPNGKERLEALASAKTETDQWIAEHITKKYNIDPIWRWTDRETDYGKNLVPPIEENVVPFLKVIDRAFLDVYVQVRGKDFLYTYVPKQFLLVGSHSYNPSDGTITLGQAEGGRKIVFFGVNHFKSQGRILRNLHTMYHEFSHILHQTKLYSEEYEKITPEGYTAQWHNNSLQQALEKGFISAYAMANKNEDFVEMIAFYLTLSPQEWEQRLASIDGSIAAREAVKIAQQEGKTPEEQRLIGEAVAEKTKATALAALKQKLSMIKEYLELRWDIHPEELRRVAGERIAEVLKGDNTSAPSPSLGALRQSTFVEEAHECVYGTEPELQ